MKRKGHIRHEPHSGWRFQGRFCVALIALVTCAGLCSSVSAQDDFKGVTLNYDVLTRRFLNDESIRLRPNQPFRVLLKNVNSFRESYIVQFKGVDYHTASLPSQLAGLFTRSDTAITGVGPQALRDVAVTQGTVTEEQKKALSPAARTAYEAFITAYEQLQKVLREARVLDGYLDFPDTLIADAVAGVSNVTVRKRTTRDVRDYFEDLSKNMPAVLGNSQAVRSASNYLATDTVKSYIEIGQSRASGKAALEDDFPMTVLYELESLAPLISRPADDARRALIQQLSISLT